MPSYKCDLCDKTYSYKRNLKRHVREKHRDIEHWNCVEGECIAKFIRREYLSKHLRVIHGYEKMKAHEAACLAPRGDVESEHYYDDESADDTVFDLIAERDNAEYNQRYVDTIQHFDNSVFKDHRSVQEGNCSKNVDIAHTNVNEAANEAKFAEMIVVENADGNKGNEDMESEWDYDDEISVNADELNNVAETGDISRNKDDVNSENVNSDVTSDVCDYNNDERSNGMTNGANSVVRDDMLSVVKETDDSVCVDDGISNISSDDDLENMDPNVEFHDAFYGDDAENTASDVDGNDLIVISSDEDEGVLAVPDEVVITETFIMTVIRKTRFINGGVIDSNITLDQEYYRT